MFALSAFHRTESIYYITVLFTYDIPIHYLPFPIIFLDIHEKIPMVHLPKPSSDSLQPPLLVTLHTSPQSYILPIPQLMEACS